MKHFCGRARDGECDKVCQKGEKMRQTRCDGMADPLAYAAGEQERPREYADSRERRRVGVAAARDHEANEIKKCQNACQPGHHTRENCWKGARFVVY